MMNKPTGGADCDFARGERITILAARAPTPALLSRIHQVTDRMEALDIDHCMFNDGEGQAPQVRCNLYKIIDLPDRRYVAAIEYGGEAITAEADLYQAGCFRALAGIFAGIAHDMRGRLNNIVVNLELLKSAMQIAAKANPYSERWEAPGQRDVAVQQVYQLDKSIQSLLEIIDVSSVADSTFNLSELLDEVQVLVKTPARLKSIKWLWQPLMEPVAVYGNKAALRRALLHVLIPLIDSAATGSTLSGGATLEDGRCMLEMRGTTTEAKEAGLKMLFGSALSEMLVDRFTATAFMARSLLAAAGGTVDFVLDVESRQFLIRLNWPASAEQKSAEGYFQ